MSYNDGRLGGSAEVSTLKIRTGSDTIACNETRIMILLNRRDP